MQKRRTGTPIENNPWFLRFGVAGVILGFIVDLTAFIDMMRGGNMTLLWVTAVVLSLLLWGAALWARRSRRKDKRLHRIALLVLWAVPIIALISFLGYQFWRVLPPSKTIVLVADFRDPNGVD